MLWRHLCLARAGWAAGLLSGLAFVGTAGSVRASADQDTPAPAKAESVVETVNVLDARKAGDLALELRGAGETKVKMTLKNKSGKRLNVVIPPGLVASSTAGQGRGGGFQSMGLGSASNLPGTFGDFRTAANPNQTGFRSVSVSDRAKGVVVPAGESVDLTLTSVCLNYGIKTPTARDRFELVTVEDYSTDARVRRALKSLATYGTSQGVAQAVMWSVCNGVPFSVLADGSSKVINRRELALASRFVDALDLSNSDELVDPAYLTEGRVFVRVVADGAVAKDAARLTNEIEGLRVLGLPVRRLNVVDANNEPVVAPALMISVVLSAGPTGESMGKIGVSTADSSGNWTPLGKTSFVETVATSALDGKGFARAVDRSVSSAFVKTKTVGRSETSTALRIENLLPFTIAGVSVKSGLSPNSPSVPFAAVGIAPSRMGVIAVEGASAKVDHVELNGL